MAIILLPGTNWQGNLLEHIGNAFEKLGYTAFHEYYIYPNSSLYRLSGLSKIAGIKAKLIQESYVAYNKKVKELSLSLKPHLLFTLSGGRLFPETVQYLRKVLGIITVTFVADNPFDSSRDKYYAMSLQHYDYIFVAEKKLISLIQKVSPNSKVFKIIAGYNPEAFYPIDKKGISENDIRQYQCDLSFTGANYGQGAEGAYRAGILNQLNEFDLRIWGYGDWPFRFDFYPSLKKAFKGDSLDLNDLRKLYTLSSVNLNLPSPQILTGLWPRIFDIAAVKGFQIIDDREELWDYFGDEDIITFTSIPELRDKIKYFLQNLNCRVKFIENLYEKVTKNFTWQMQLTQILDIIKN